MRLYGSLHPGQLSRTSPSSEHAMKAPFVSVRDLSMSYNGKDVLEKISFSLDEGEVVGIIGRTGSGKTILMNLLRGIGDPPSSGSVIYHVSSCMECGQVFPAGHAGGECPVCRGGLERHERPSVAARCALRCHSLRPPWCGAESRTVCGTACRPA